jgi:hypothetical protein
MFPITTTETEGSTDRQPVKHDLYDLDNLISDLNTPKEQIQQSRPQMAGQSALPGSERNEYIDSPVVEPIPAEIAALSGKAIAGTIDTVLSTGLSLYAKGGTAEKYEASPKQIEKLNQAWGAVAQKYNYKVEDSPWFNVILLMVAVYFPIWRIAQDDKRFAEMNDRIKEMEVKQRETAARLDTIESKPE